MRSILQTLNKIKQRKETKKTNKQNKQTKEKILTCNFVDDLHQARGHIDKKPYPKLYLLL